MRPAVALDYRPALLSRAGIGRAVRELARALGERRDGDLALHLFGHSLAAARVPHREPVGARLHRLPIPGRALPLLRRLGLGADRLAGGAAVFHWTDYVQPPVCRARAVLTVHDLAFWRDASWHGEDAAVLRVRTERAAAAAAAVVVPSRATAGDVARWLPAAHRVEVIPFGGDHVPTAPLPRPAVAARDYVVAVGTVEPRKNHRALLAALRLLPAPRPLLIVVGRRGWECAAIADELEAACAAGDAIWLEHADDAATWALLAHAQLCVYPSLWEGFGFPPLEAMALGTPVVAHAVAPLEELTDGNALLCDAAAPDALAAAIARGLGDDALRSRLAIGGRARAAAFRWRDCAAAHAALYREVAA
ncbi:MAG: glycosyltransferase family 4 protein [Planctomycetota bacterium]